MSNRGFTLIEVLIVIAIFALIILVAAPLSGQWVTDANRLEAEGQLSQAMGRAKAAALRNYVAATDNTTVVTAMCLSDDNILTVLEGTPSTTTPVYPDCSAPTGTQLWRAKLHAGITAQLNATDFACLYFNNKGLPIKDCSSTITSVEFTLIAGGETLPVALH